MLFEINTKGYKYNEKILGEMMSAIVNTMTDTLVRLNKISEALNKFCYY